MRLIAAVIAALVNIVLFVAPARAQGLYDTNQQGSTISVTNTFQQVLPRDESRHGCTIVNYGTHTMYVYFGSIANATLTNTFQLSPGQPILCVIGYDIIKAQISITGTAGDAYVYSTQ